MSPFRPFSTTIFSFKCHMSTEKTLSVFASWLRSILTQPASRKPVKLINKFSKYNSYKQNTAVYLFFLYPLTGVICFSPIILQIFSHTKKQKRSSVRVVRSLKF